MSQSNYDPVRSIYRMAFEQRADEIRAVPDENFVTLSLDIPATVVTVQGAYPAILALRPEFVANLPTFDISKVDKLESYALAMFCAQADFKAAAEPPASLMQLAKDATATRAVLLADVNAHISRGLLAPSVINGLHGVNGYKNAMMDIATLASILRKHAPKIAERTSVRPEELTAAEDLANQLGKAVGLREQAPQVIAEAGRNRLAAYTLFVNSYEEVRTAVQYLRRKQRDADSIAPSLFANRGLRRKPSDANLRKLETPVPLGVTQPAASTPAANTNSNYMPAAHAAEDALGSNSPFMD